MKHLFYIVLFCGFLNLQAQTTFTLGGVNYKVLNATAKTVEITANSCTTGIGEDTVINNGTTYTIVSIGNSAFEGCTKLSSINFWNSSLLSIGEKAFKGCTGIEGIDFYIDNSPPLQIDSNVFEGLNLSNTILWVKCNENISIYMKTPVWKDFGEIIDNTLFGGECNIASTHHLTKIDIDFTISNHILEINKTNNPKFSKLEITNTLGQIVKTSTETTVDISNLQTGIYILLIKTKKGNFTKKFIK